MSTPNPRHERDTALNDVQIPALMDAQAQLKLMQDAWWRVNDALLLAQISDEAINDLNALKEKLKHLQRTVNQLAEQARTHHDQITLEELSPIRQDKEDVRKRLAHADLNLSALYQHLQVLCHRSAESLAQEVSSKSINNDFSFWDAEVRAELDYMLDESHPLYDENSDNILASQEPIFWPVTAEGVQAHVMSDDPTHDNWLDYQSPWMTRQGWLTHDVLEHNYGRHPRFGMAALLHTHTVWVEVHTVRSYAYDLHAGKFVKPEMKT